MPVLLPVAPACAIPLPSQPQNPATLDDIADAIEFNNRIRVSRQAGGATKADVGRGAVYEAALIEDNAGAAAVPAWFQPAMNAILHERPAPLIRNSNRTHNLLCGDGHTRPFQVVPFVNGDDPTNPPPAAPGQPQVQALIALTNVAAIRGLTGPEATAYLTGYNIPAPPLIIDRKRLIREEIGCTAAL